MSKRKKQSLWEPPYFFVLCTNKKIHSVHILYIYKHILFPKCFLRWAWNSMYYYNKLWSCVILLFFPSQPYGKQQAMVCLFLVTVISIWLHSLWSKFTSSYSCPRKRKKRKGNPISLDCRQLLRWIIYQLPDIWWFHTILRMPKGLFSPSNLTSQSNFFHIIRLMPVTYSTTRPTDI